MNKKGIIIEQCFRCGAEFDLNYDFDGFDDYEDFENYKADPFCWRCRAVKTFSDVIGRKRKMSRTEKKEIESAFGNIGA